MEVLSRHLTSQFDVWRAPFPVTQHDLKRLQYLSAVTGEKVKCEKEKVETEHICLTSLSNRSVEWGWNVYVRLRAERTAGGEEAVVLTARYGPITHKDKVNEESVESVGFMTAIMNALSTTKWRSRDTLFVLSPECYGPQGVNHFAHVLHDTQYRVPNNSIHYSGGVVGVMSISMSDQLPRGTIFIEGEGLDGQQPNLDLINVAVRVALQATQILRNQRVEISLPSTPAWLNRAVTTVLNSAPLSALSAQFPQSKYLLSPLLYSAYRLGLGLPRADHALLAPYAISAITLSLNAHADAVPNHPTLRVFYAAVMGTVRSLNNINEQLHQSYRQYLLPSPYLFVPIGHYTPTLGLLLAPILLYAALTLLVANQQIRHTSLATTFIAQIFGTCDT